MLNTKLNKKKENYTEAKFDIIKYLNTAVTVDLSKPQNAIEVDLGNLNLAYEIEDEER